MADGWLCEACRSLNKSRDQRCYSCRVPRRAVEHERGAAAIVRSTAATPATPLALAVRGGARYRPSWLLALLIAPLIVAVAVLDAMFWPATLARIRADGSFMGDPATTDLWGQFALEMGLMVAAGALWSVWIATCLANIPALTGRWPGFGTSDALFAPLGRRSGYYRPMHVVREVVDEFAGQRVWPGVLVTAWWAAWIGTIVVPGAVAVARRFLGAGSMRDMIDAVSLRPYLVAIAAVLAVSVLGVVEWLQHRARVELATTLATAGEAATAASMSPDGPTAEQPPTPDAPTPDRPTLTPPRPPARPSPRRGRTQTIAALVLALAVVGGIAGVALVGTGVLPGSRPVSDVTTAGSGTTQSPEPRPTPAEPTPTAAPVDHPVIARMLAYTRAPGVSGRWQTSTRIEAGAWSAETARVDAARSRGEGWTRTWSLQSSGDLGVVAETALVNGRAYSRAPNRPWDESPASADTPPPVVPGAEPWDHLVYEGRVRRDGERLHRIGFERYGAEAGARFTEAFADRQATVTETAGWILVRDDGTPVLLVARVDGLVDAATPAVFRVTTTYTDMGIPMSISLGGIPPAIR